MAAPQKNLVHFLHMEIMGDYKKPLRKLAAELGLQKRFMKKIFDGDGITIKYGLEFNALSCENGFPESDTRTYFDLYAENLEKAKRVYEKIGGFFDKICDETEARTDNAIPRGTE